MRAPASGTVVSGGGGTVAAGAGGRGVAGAEPVGGLVGEGG
ncbi:MAG: hypothetical protein QGG34_13700 [SAR202 cluster bacterium]|nr:hypothetical protein [SAR202 cluster bacterium]MDP6302149.1 hypothetical protein [SAR202 cluster bacterium]MDP7104868.1 hypothetical protein [SAR202 cluster bacterium]MDP7226577.1 hypothetical protein [SAR202 cluster bacterium]MDP7413817.1 hypothetical protein [SAR202 cluster bacterium]